MPGNNDEKLFLTIGGTVSGSLTVHCFSWNKTIIRATKIEVNIAVNTPCAPNQSKDSTMLCSSVRVNGVSIRKHINAINPKREPSSFGKNSSAKFFAIKKTTYIASIPIVKLLIAISTDTNPELEMKFLTASIGNTINRTANEPTIVIVNVPIIPLEIACKYLLFEIFSIYGIQRSNKFSSDFILFPPHFN